MLNEDNGNHEQYNGLRTDEDSQCNFNRAAIARAIDSNAEGKEQEWLA